MNAPLSFRVEGRQVIATLVDSRGKESEYAVTASGGVVTVVKPSGKTHLVAGGRCDCEAARFRRDCKHRRFAAAFLPLLEALGSRGQVVEEQQRRELFLKLAEPFDAGEVKFKPQTVNGNRALVLAYVDARVVRTGSTRCWVRRTGRTTTSAWPDGSVLCRLQGAGRRRVADQGGRRRPERAARRRRPRQGGVVATPSSGRRQVRHRPLPVPAAAGRGATTTRRRRRSSNCRSCRPGRCRRVPNRPTPEKPARRRTAHTRSHCP